MDDGTTVIVEKPRPKPYKVYYPGEDVIECETDKDVNKILAERQGQPWPKIYFEGPFGRRQLVRVRYAKNAPQHQRCTCGRLCRRESRSEKVAKFHCPGCKAPFHVKLGGGVK